MNKIPALNLSNYFSALYRFYGGFKLTIRQLARLFWYTNSSFETSTKDNNALINQIALIRPEQNPIISPRPENGWEAWQTFNPGAVLINNRVHFLYRGLGPDGVSRFGYAVSNNGFTIKDRLSYPVFTHETKKRVFNVYSYASGGSWSGGAEDPRLVRVNNEDTVYVTYTACDDGLRVGFTSIKVDDLINRRWKWKQPVCISPPGKVNKNWLIFPEKINGKYAILHAIAPEILIEYFDNLDFDGETFIENSIDPKLVPMRKGSCWDKKLRGAGAPPIKTAEGWLVFYHAMDTDWSKYKVGVMLLDLKDPTKILCRAREPILEPIKDYENNGYKPGIVYVSGAVVKNGELLVYYGCSDSYIGVAYANLDRFLKALKENKEPKLKSKALKRK